MTGNNLAYQGFYRRSLPHIQPKGRIFFITYRLNFSLPQSVIQKLQNITRTLQESLPFADPGQKSETIRRLNRKKFLILDQYLDQCRTSPQWLADRRIASIVMNSLHFIHDRTAKLYCYTIMPNHVHLLLKPGMKQDGEVYSLASIMHSHKSFTANEANRILNREGTFWQHESFDHYIRSLDEMLRTCRYIMKNPLRTGLVQSYKDWPYFWIDKETERLLESCKKE